MRRRFLLSGVIALLCICLTGCLPDHIRELRELGLTHPGGYTCGHKDTHGGFHGDGVLQIQFYVPNIREEDLIDLPGWQPAPLPEAVQSMLYGLEKDGVSYGAYIEDAPPPDRSAYWFFCDRQNEKTTYTDTELWTVLQRPSANFTLAVWVPLEQMIYYLKFDS